MTETVLPPDKNATITVGEKLTNEQASAILSSKRKPKETPVAEKPQEPTPAETPLKEGAKPQEAAAEATSPVEQPKRKKAKDIVQEFFKPKPQEEKPLDIVELQKQLEAERKARTDLENQLKDPIYQVSKALKDKGKKALDVFKEIKIIDHSKMSDEELYRYELQKNGVTDTEEVENELAKFAEQSALARKKEIQAIRNGIDADNENTEQTFLKTINAQDPNEEKLLQRIQKDAEALHAGITGLIDKPVVPGVMFTKDIAEKILNNIAQSKVAIPTKEDGTTDINALIEREIKAEMFDICIETLTANTEAETIHKVYNEIEATPDSLTQTSRPPQPIHKVEKGTEEYAKQVSESLRPRRV